MEGHSESEKIIFQTEETLTQGFLCNLFVSIHFSFVDFRFQVVPSWAS